MTAAIETHDAHDAPEAHGGGHGTATGLTNEKLSMWVFLGSECLLFGGLISTFLLYKEKSPKVRPTIHALYDIPYASVSWFVLLMSSLTMVLAVSAVKRNDLRAMRVWITTTALLG